MSNDPKRDVFLNNAAQMIAATLAAPLIARQDNPTPQDAARIYREVYAAICAPPG